MLILECKEDKEMKRKKVLKKWVERVLVIMLIFSILILSFDSNSTYYFVLSKIIGLLMIVAITHILSKYTNIFEDESN